jgi:superfamily I DNA/RNA helicase
MPAQLFVPVGAGPYGRDSVSIFSGPEPEVAISNGPEEEIQKVTAWLQQLLSRGLAASDIAIFARTNRLVEQRARHVVGRLGLQAHLLSDDELPEPKRIAVGTMHRAKGLEFRVVVVMGCEEKYLPNQYVLGLTPDAVAREQVVEQERSLFYVACTRARERLLVSCGGEASRFLG